MNLPKFLNEVDHVSNIMSREQLAEFIHDIARTLPEVRRVEFLERLKKLLGQAENGTVKDAESEKSRSLSQTCELLRAKLERIRTGEIYLIGLLNEEYDSWYNSDSEEFLYEDPEEILKTIEDACDFVHRCVDCEEYKKAYETALLLVGLKITIGGDYLDYSDALIAVHELKYYHLSDLDYTRFIVDALHAAYCVNELPQRADALYTMIEDSGLDDITLELLLQNGAELPETEQFLRLWIAYLGEITSANAQRLIKEAVELIDDPEQALEYARKYHVRHPALYELYLRNNPGQEDAGKLFEVGKEALENIDPRYIVRSRIALLTGRMALELDKKEEAEKCWLEAFRSDTRVVNYLRLIMEYTDFSKVKDEAERICHAMYSETEKIVYAYTSDSELAENKICANMMYMLAFLEGEFQYVEDHAMKVEHSLGWSTTFMKCGLAAFLLLLLEDTELKQGCQQMCHKVVSDTGFDVAEYQSGLTDTADVSNEEWFWKCFCRWKEMVSLPEDKRREYAEWIEKLITKRVDGIMDGNYRNYYGECASYIAALGEVKESMGFIGGKQSTMMGYKMRYSRRSAFLRELMAYGMREQKKR